MDKGSEKMYTVAMRSNKYFLDFSHHWFIFLPLALSVAGLVAITPYAASADEVPPPTPDTSQSQPIDTTTPPTTATPPVNQGTAPAVSVDTAAPAVPVVPPPNTATTIIDAMRLGKQLLSAA